MNRIETELEAVRFMKAVKFALRYTSQCVEEFGTKVSVAAANGLRTAARLLAVLFRLLT